jgi:hypothetical protein
LVFSELDPVNTSYPRRRGEIGDPFALDMGPKFRDGTQIQPWRVAALALHYVI